MKNKYTFFSRTMKPSFIIFLVLLTAGFGCKKHEIPFPLNEFERVNLVADSMGYNAARIDVNLVNAWGIAVAPSGPLWISANHTGVSTIYDKNGTTLLSPVTIPSQDMQSAGSPTGVVFNGTTDFMIPVDPKSSASPKPAKFIFASEDGIVTAWNSGNSAKTVADRSASGAVYKGLALANDGSANFLYVTNFNAGKIDVYDKSFNYVTNKPFLDPSIPAGYAPFNIRNIDGKLYVTYAKQKPDKHDDQSGPGNGYVNIFNPDGSLIKRFVSRGHLNSPWGIVQAQAGFFQFEKAILIGNFGDGHINVYDDEGRYEGQLQDDKRVPIIIDGLWALENNVPGADAAQLFFTAGPGMESHGIFGYLKKM